MAAGNPQTTNLTAGELSPLLDGRQDLDFYANGCRRLENMIVLPHGPARRRGGSIFKAEVKNSAAFTSSLDFEFSIEQAYKIEAGERYFRFFRNQARGEVTETDAAIVNGTFDADIAGWTDVSAGTGAIGHDAGSGRLSLNTPSAGNEAAAEQQVAHSKIGQLHVLQIAVFGAVTDSITLKLGTTSGGTELLERVLEVGTHAIAFVPTATPFFLRVENPFAKALQIDDVALIGSGAAAPAPLELAAPYLSAEVAAIQTTQSADVLYLVHPDHFTRKLERRSDADWSLVLFPFKDGPWGLENTDASITLTPSAASGLGISITASKNLFAATDVGRNVRIKNGGGWGWAVITSFANPTVVTADVRKAFALGAESAWRLGLYSDTTGHPRAVTFHDQRLVFGGHRALPIAYEASKIGAFETFTPGIADDDPISGLLAANKVNAILWLASDDVLLCGTQARVWRVGSKINEETITPTKAPNKSQAPTAAAPLPPVEAGDAWLFVGRHGRKLRELRFAFENEKYNARDVTQRAEHVTLGGITDLAWQQEPWGIVWAVTGLGALLGFTYLREENVLAWHRHPLGGGGLAEAVTVIPGQGQDEVWLTVRRSIGGQTRRFVELLDEDFTDDKAVEDAFFVDSGLKYDGPAVTVLAGLDHLEGEPVQVLADGAAHPDKVVAGGQITLDRPTSKAAVGLAMPWRLSPTRYELQLREGSSSGETKAVNRLVVNLYRTLGLKIGADEASLQEVPFRTPEDLMDKPLPLFTGERDLPFPGSHELDPRILLGGDLPLPATVVSLAPKMEVSAR